MSEEQGNISARFCIFCCKTIIANTNFVVSGLAEISQTFVAKNVEKEGNLKRFFTLLPRYLGIGILPSVVSKLLLLADERENDFGGEKDGLGVSACQLCGTLLSSFCELYHQLKCVELQIQWKTQTLLRIMKEAGRVPSRMKALKEGFGGEGSGCVTQEKYKRFIDLRQETIRICSKGLSLLPPMVRLENLNSTKMQPPCKQKPEIDLQRIIYGWILSFAAVVGLLLSPNSSDTVPRATQTIGTEEDPLDANDVITANQCGPVSPIAIVHAHSTSSINGGGDCSENCDKTVEYNPEKLAAIKSCIDYDHQDDHGAGSEQGDGLGLEVGHPYCSEVAEIKNVSVVESYSADGDQQLAIINEEVTSIETVSETKILKIENTHTEISDDRKRFACSYCSSNYSCNHTLALHLRKRHPGVRRQQPQKFGAFFCKLCTKGYSNYRQYFMHMKTFMHRRRSKCRGIGSVDDAIFNNKQAVDKSRKLTVKSGDTRKKTNYKRSHAQTSDKLPAENKNPLESGVSSPNKRYNLRAKRHGIQNSKTEEADVQEDLRYEDLEFDSGDSSSLEESSSACSSSSSIDSENDNEDEIRSRVKVEEPKRVYGKRKRPITDGWMYCRLEGCNYSTPDVPVYEEHKRLHEPGNYPCKFCDVVETNAIKLSAHELKNHSPKPKRRRMDVFSCPRCPYTATQRLVYVNHFARFHLGFSRLNYEPCPICHVQIANGRQVRHFTANHDTTNVDPEKIVKCREKDCGAYFTSKKGAIWRHRYEVHKVQDELLNSEDDEGEGLTCPVCHREFVSEYQFRHHKQLFHRKDPSGKNDDDVSRDVICKTATKTFICPVFECTQNFKQMELLEKHRKLHGNFQCNFCETVKDFAPDLPLHELEHNSGTNNGFQCPRCKFSSALKTSYITHHLENHLELTDRIFSCNICSHRFRTSGAKATHFKTHHRQTGNDPSAVKKCSQCPAYFLLDTQLQVHENMCAKKSSVDKNPSNLPQQKNHYICPDYDCNEGFRCAEDLAEHGKLHGSFKCQFCQVSKGYAFDLATHEMEEHSKGDGQTGKRKLHQCARCSYNSPTQSIYARHFVEKHLRLNARVHTCSICKASTLTMNGLQRHRIESHKTEGVDPDTIQKCDQCSAYFLQQIQLIQHRRMIHDDKSLQCAVCDKTYKSSQSLTQHRYNIHGIGKSNDSFQFPCELSPDCKARFKTREELEWHKNFSPIHKGQCMKNRNTDKLTCEKCGKEFKGQSALKWHLKSIHKMDRPTEFKCDQCEKVFSRKGGLKQHQQFHQKPDKWDFMCAVCSKKCVSKGALKSHMNTHANNKPFVCQVCGEKYAHRHNLRNHVNSKHKDEGVQDIAKMMNRKNAVSRKGKKLGTGFCITSGVQGQSISVNEESE